MKVKVVLLLYLTKTCLCLNLAAIFSVMPLQRLKRQTISGSFPTAALGPVMTGAASSYPSAITTVPQLTPTVQQVSFVPSNPPTVVVPVINPQAAAVLTQINPGRVLGNSIKMMGTVKNVYDFKRALDLDRGIGKNSLKLVYGWAGCKMGTTIGTTLAKTNGPVETFLGGLLGCLYGNMAGRTAVQMTFGR